MVAKVMFVTGGLECECEGTGRIEAGHSKRTNRPVYLQCSCVEAREAELVFVGGPSFRGAPSVNRLGTVVPKEG